MERIPKVALSDAEVEECNIGIEQEPKIIKISKNLTIENKVHQAHEGIFLCFCMEV